jgi:hypothetical protein
MVPETGCSLRRSGRSLAAGYSASGKRTALPGSPVSTRVEHSRRTASRLRRRHSSGLWRGSPSRSSGRRGAAKPHGGCAACRMVLRSSHDEISPTSGAHGVGSRPRRRAFLARRSPVSVLPQIDCDGVARHACRNPLTLPDRSTAQESTSSDCTTLASRLRGRAGLARLSCCAVAQSARSSWQCVSCICLQRMRLCEP